MSDEQKYIIQGLDEYIRQGEPQQRERSEAWKDIETNSVVGTTEITDFNNLRLSDNSVVETTDSQKPESETDSIRQLRLTNDVCVARLR